MNYEYRNAVVQVISNLIVSTYVIVQTARMVGAQVHLAEGGLAQWAQMVLWAVPISIVVTIVGTIGFNIVWAIVTRTESPSFLVDERDRQISNFAFKVTMVVASAGFILGTVFLAFGLTAFTAFCTIYAGFALGDLSGSVTRIIKYREFA